MNRKQIIDLISSKSIAELKRLKGLEKKFKKYFYPKILPNGHKIIYLPGKKLGKEYNDYRESIGLGRATTSIEIFRPGDLKERNLKE